MGPHVQQGEVQRLSAVELGVEMLPHRRSFSFRVFNFVPLEDGCSAEPPRSRYSTEMASAEGFLEKRVALAALQDGLDVGVRRLALETLRVVPLLGSSFTVALPSTSANHLIFRSSLRH